MTAKQLRSLWIEFFQSHGFYDVSDRSVIPSSNDKSLLFVNSGVAAIKSYFCGDVNIPNQKLVSVQRVIRTGDIDSIGKSFRHHTYFEMMGNFSVGNASRREAIELAWKFLVDVVKLDSSRLCVTVFDEDRETESIWKELIPEERIALCGRDTNFWDMGVGPCGPCTEIYFDKGEKYDEKGLGMEMLRKDIENNRYLEIWNLVFSDFLNVEGDIVPSATQNLDTGAGLERFLTILQNKESNFETTLFTPIVEYLSSFKEDLEKQHLWAAVDYFRTSCILMRDGISFGNKGREYVLRRIFRKACSYFYSQRLNYSFFQELTRIISETLDYYDWSKSLESITQSFFEEYKSAAKSKDVAESLLHDLLTNKDKNIDAKEVFNLVTRHGLSMLVIEQIFEEHDKTFDRDEYQRLFEEHKKLSFNEKISSAFIKQIPNLMLEAEGTEMDYVNTSIQSSVLDIYYGESFDKLLSPVEGDIDVYVALKETIIFPLAAGQAADYGELLVDGFEPIPLQVSFKAPNGQILHKLEGISPELQKALLDNKRVSITLDSQRRKGISQHHTAEHLMYAIFKKVVNEKITRVSGSKHEDHFSLEILLPTDIEKESIDLIAINEHLNKAISDSIEVSTTWGCLDEAKRLGIVGHFEEIYEMNKDKLRFVSIGEYGVELCVGTHVRNTSEIESALIVKSEKKQKHIYKFKVIVGNERVSEFLKSRNIGTSKDYLMCLQNKGVEEKNRKAVANELFNRKKQELIKELLSFEEGKNKNILERVCEMDVALGAFKEIRKYLNNQVVALYFKEEDAYRFFIASQGPDVKKLLDSMREKGAKCGGNNSFGSGTWEVSDFRQLLEEYISSIN